MLLEQRHTNHNSVRLQTDELAHNDSKLTYLHIRLQLFFDEVRIMSFVGTVVDQSRVSISSPGQRDLQLFVWERLGIVDINLDLDVLTDSGIRFRSAKVLTVSLGAPAAAIAAEDELSFLIISLQISRPSPARGYAAHSYQNAPMVRHPFSSGAFPVLDDFEFGNRAIKR